MERQMMSASDFGKSQSFEERGIIQKSALGMKAVCEEPGLL
jgi:hypothetical protein